MKRWPLLLLLVPATAQAQGAKPPPPGRAPRELFAYPVALLSANRVQCYTEREGALCLGAVWPLPYQQQYIFYSGLTVAAIIPPGAGFAWAGDTTGANFADLRGSVHGVARSAGVFNSRDTADAAGWPTGAVVRDAETYHAGLLGRDVISDQDLWTRYWDGNPALLSGRTHPLGVAVDQRMFAWNHPTASADIVYIAYTLYNVTARDPGAYVNATIPVELQPEIAALGRIFQDSVEAALAVAIPDGGYAFDSTYVGFLADPDIATFSTNYATVSLPFGLGIAYDGRFRDDQGWVYPAEIFGAPPFLPVPGLLGTTFLKAPAGVAEFSNFANVVHVDPISVQQRWRYLSGNLDTASGDVPCPVANPKERHVCFISQTPRDQRFELSRGPFRLDPGHATTLMVAYLLAPPLDTVQSYIGGDLKPGIPFTGDSIAADTTKILTIERAAGWVTQTDANGNGAIEGNEVTAARRSLMYKAQFAQAVVDAKFLLPQPPEAPPFFLMPGDNAVTIVWQPSPTETAGDPYFALASDPSSTLYDPSYRRLDVEGYRIYRGRSPGALELIAQFDHDHTRFVDYVGALEYPGRRCAPELGIVADCPVSFPPTPSAGVSVTSRIQGKMLQVPEGHRYLTSTGALNTVGVDTFPRGSARFSYLDEGGVTFAFTDSGVRNSFPYYYAVTAFDFNSIRSGPSSFESARVVKMVTPRVSSKQETGGGVQPMRLLALNGDTLDPTAPLPSISATTGIFSGPMPPTDGLSLAFSAFLPQLVGTGTLTVTIDSVTAGMARTDLLGPGFDRPALYYLRAVSGADTTRFTVPLGSWAAVFRGDSTASQRFEAVAVDSAQATRFGGDRTFSLAAQVALTVPNGFVLTGWGRGDANNLPLGSAFNGPRWWAGATNETTPDPNGGNCSPSSGGCGSIIRVPDLTRTAGGIGGATIAHVQAYNTVPNSPGRLFEAVLATVTRAADFQVVWGAGGAIDTVIDLTHRVGVPFSPRIGPSWGILNQESFAAVTEALTRDGKNALLTWSDLACVAPLTEFMPHDALRFDCGGLAQTAAVLQRTATLSPIAIRDSGSSYAGTADPAYTATGSGFIFYLNGHFFLMQLASFPPAGTVWQARFYAGAVTGSAASGNFAFEPATRPPAVPRLRAQLAFAGSQLDRFATADSLLARVHTVPDPFYAASGYELTPDTLALKFVNLPARALIRIYSQSGILVQILTHDDPTGGGEATWDLNSRSGRRVASGVYFFHIETPDHRSRVGRFTVVTGPRRGSGP